ncbi:hypothetical protein PtA15_4A365 [Puccinia triticina]|uniref:Palmitoyltransferase n=1 Tax=Puccinia triticina TaxID=208348 RepID=A0ABY7CJB8_9BASI|nr:uncharacterized protein PtA15_4A365 [Puccinia triticina]WAQ83915.1 hypothetical protein PtA15_4A365 [Puccinia triticina]WAR54761.1 hypothetical protein PtB15_4B379 [Puccinia triticina]
MNPHPPQPPHSLPQLLPTTTTTTTTTHRTTYYQPHSNSSSAEQLSHQPEQHPLPQRQPPEQHQHKLPAAQPLELRSYSGKQPLPTTQEANPLVIQQHQQRRPKKKQPRVYQAHPGNLVFCCRGRLVSSRPAHSIPLSRRRTASRPAEPQEDTEGDERSDGRPGPRLAMARTVASDPGILPRGLDPNPEMVWKPASIPPAEPPPPPPIDDQRREKPFEYDQVGQWELLPRWIKLENTPRASRLSNTTSQQPVPLDFVSDEDVGWIQSKWCTTCESYRPPRSSHCRMCDCCIDGVHYLNNCIGSRNYRSFFTFLMASVLSLMLMIGCAIWRLFFIRDPPQQPVASEAGEGASDGATSQAVLATLGQNPLAIVVLVLSFILLLPIASLLGYHMFLTFHGLTTVEYIKSQTTKRVLKENKKLVSQLYRPGEAHGGRRAGGGCKRAWTTAMRSLFLITPDPHALPGSTTHASILPGPAASNRASNAPNHSPPPQIRRPNNFIIARLCRPDTDTYVQWSDPL